MGRGREGRCTPRKGTRAKRRSLSTLENVINLPFKVQHGEVAQKPDSNEGYYELRGKYDARCGHYGYQVSRRNTAMLRTMWTIKTENVLLVDFDERWILKTGDKTIWLPGQYDQQKTPVKTRDELRLGDFRAM